MKRKKKVICKDCAHAYYRLRKGKTDRLVCSLSGKAKCPYTKGCQYYERSAF